MKSCTVYDFFIFLITFIHIFIYNVFTKQTEQRFPRKYSACRVYFKNAKKGEKL